MSDLQRITEFGELQTALETIAELKAINVILQHTIQQLLDRESQTIIATKEFKERYDSECG